MKPSGPLPARDCASLSRAMMPARIGAEAEEPDPPP